MVFFPAQLNLTHQPTVGEVHKHADFAVFINNQQLNFSQPKYMSSANHSLNLFMHLHDGDGNVIHQHARGITLATFFKSLGMTFNSTCFALDNRVTYCNNASRRLKFYVNGHPNNAFGNYEFQDLDKILISYGAESEIVITQQLESITGKACIQSGKCPEKGSASNESSCLPQGNCSSVR